MHVINLVKKNQTLHYHRSVLLMQPSPTDKATLAADPKNLSVQDTNSVQEVPRGTFVTPDLMFLVLRRP